MGAREIELPEAKPALEWVNGRAVQKVSPQRQHALAQLAFGAALHAWASARGSGQVGTEWEIRIQPPGEDRRPLVSDVAYISYERLPFEDEPAADIPRVAPDAVVEILSPRDHRPDVDEKIRVYLAAGTSVVFTVDTEVRVVTAHELQGVRTFGVDETVAHRTMPGFAMPVARLFERPHPKP